MIKWVSGNTDGFLKILRKILVRFEGKVIDLWVDNASWHKGRRVREFITETKGLFLHYLPPYHPELNMQERLWKRVRYEETNNAYYATLDDLEAGVMAASRRWKPLKVRRLCLLT